MLMLIIVSGVLTCLSGVCAYAYADAYAYALMKTCQILVFVFVCVAFCGKN